MLFVLAQFASTVSRYSITVLGKYTLSGIEEKDLRIFSLTQPYSSNFFALQLT